VNATLTEAAYLAERAASHAARMNVHAGVHASTCKCGRRPTYCTRCDRDVESWSLTFFRGDFLCGDCLEETGADQVIADQDAAALAAQ